MTDTKNVQCKNQGTEKWSTCSLHVAPVVFHMAEKRCMFLWIWIQVDVVIPICEVNPDAQLPGCNKFHCCLDMKQFSIISDRNCIPRSTIWHKYGSLRSISLWLIENAYRIRIFLNSVCLSLYSLAMDLICYLLFESISWWYIGCYTRWIRNNITLVINFWQRW